MTVGAVLIRAHALFVVDMETDTHHVQPCDDGVVSFQSQPVFLGEEGLQFGQDVAREEEVKESSSQGLGRGNCKPFSSEIVAQLKALWSAGMVGVGDDRYGDLIKLACTRTGLSGDQVKVSRA